jgi:hypothetical protein
LAERQEEVLLKKITKRKAMKYGQKHEHNTAISAPRKEISNKE